MKLTVEQSAIAGALASCARIITRKATIPVMQHVVVDADAEGLRLTASDLDCQVMFRVPAKVDEPGSVAMLGDTFAGAVDRAPTDRITLQTAPNDRVQVRSGASRILVPTLDPGDFPYLAATDLGPAFKLAGEDMADMIGPCLMAAGTDTTRQFLCGVHMHKVSGQGVDDNESAPCRIAFAAGSGHIFMALQHDVDDDAPSFDPFTLPSKAAAEVARLAKGVVTVEASSRLVRFRFADGAVLISKVLEGNFPNYRTIIPVDGGATVMDAKLMSAAIGRLALADDGRDNNYARFDIRDGVVVLDRETTGKAAVYEEVSCETGAPVMFAAVHAYVSTGIKALGTDRIAIVAHTKSQSGMQPIAMRRPGSDDAVFIVAPLMLRSSEPAKADDNR